MSSTGNAEVDEDELEDEAPGLWTSFATALRLIVGWFCIAIGVLNLLVEVDRNSGDPPDTPYFVFHAMLFVGGIALLSVGWLGRRPGLPGFLTGGLVTAAGLVITGVPVTPSVCCMTAFDIRHGWPFTFAARDTGARWHIDSQHLLADLLFWGYVGLIALVIAASVRRAVTGDGSSFEEARAEQRALADENTIIEATPRAEDLRQRADGS
ncbi:hypothetical protein [Actinoplanes sp. NPDC049265]|uniref:hypothetical protein n=1 Tax=Actinoplanes sp. NPDC049265 TaxID=3363902 RepID=UPI003710E42A